MVLHNSFHLFNAKRYGFIAVLFMPGCVEWRYEKCVKNLQQQQNWLSINTTFCRQQNKTIRQQCTAQPSSSIYSKFKSRNRFSLIYVVSQLVFVREAPSHTIYIGILLGNFIVSHFHKELATTTHIGIYFIFWFRQYYTERQYQQPTTEIYRHRTE